MGGRKGIVKDDYDIMVPTSPLLIIGTILLVGCLRISLSSLDTGVSTYSVISNSPYNKISLDEVEDSIFI